MCLTRHIAVAGMLALLVVIAGAVPGAASAAAPEKLGPFVDTYSDIGFSCDGFDILIEGTQTQSETVFFDDQGEVDHTIHRVKAPHDVMTNTVTGETIVVRASFTHFYERIPGTDSFSVAITGFRYLVNRAGEGVVLQDVGRIVYATEAQEDVVFSAGVHELVYDSDLEPAFCAALT